MVTGKREESTREVVVEVAEADAAVTFRFSTGEVMTVRGLDVVFPKWRHLLPSDASRMGGATLPRRGLHDKEEMVSIMHRFNPNDWEGLPTYVNKNPHLRLTRPGENPPAELSTQDVNFTNTRFPHAHIPVFKLFGNIAAGQEAALRKIAQSKILLAAVIHGGRQHYIRRSLEKGEEIRSFIQSISLANEVTQDREVEVASLGLEGLVRVRDNLEDVQVQPPLSLKHHDLVPCTVASETARDAREVVV